MCKRIHPVTCHGPHKTVYHHRSCATGSDGGVQLVISVSFALPGTLYLCKTFSVILVSTEEEEESFHSKLFLKHSSLNENVFFFFNLIIAHILKTNHIFSVGFLVWGY